MSPLLFTSLRSVVKNALAAGRTVSSVGNKKWVTKKGAVAGAVPLFGHGGHRPNGVVPPGPTQWTVWAGGRSLSTVDSGHCPLFELWHKFLEFRRIIMNERD